MPNTYPFIRLYGQLHGSDDETTEHLVNLATREGAPQDAIRRIGEVGGWTTVKGQHDNYIVKQLRPLAVENGDAASVALIDEIIERNTKPKEAR